MSLVVDGDVWVGFLHSLQSKLSQESFNAWFQPLQFEGLDKSARLIKLRAPNPVVRDWVNTNYSSVVDESLDELNLEGYLIGWTIDEAGATSASSRNTVGKERLTLTADSVFSGSQPSGSTNTGTTTATQKEGADPGLNSRYTYDSFVVGSCN